MSTTSTMIDVPTPAGAMPAQLSRPAGAGPFPAVVVIQEAFGLNAHIKDVGQRLAGEGYVTIAPDVFHRGGRGRTAGYDELPKALQLMGELTDAGIVEDVRAAVDHLRTLPYVRADRIGITGFCMGGRVSFLAASKLPDAIAAAVPFYGGGIAPEWTATVKHPVLAFFGDQDPFIPNEQVETLRAEAKRLGKPVEIVVYAGAPHGFFCNERDSYRPDAAKDAWARLLAFFGEHLQG